MEKGAEGAALHQFHCDEDDAVCLVDFMNRSDIGMVDGRRRPGFA